MTELSDYKRIVQRPMLDDLHATISSQRNEIERLRNVLMDARDKLKLYYVRDQSYVGGVPYNVLMAQIDSFLPDQRVEKTA